MSGDLRAAVEGLPVASKWDVIVDGDPGIVSRESVLALIPEGAVLVTAKCRCSCRCHDDEALPDWPGSCAGCCEPGDNCDCGRALRHLKELR